MGTQFPFPKRGRAPFPIFGPCPLWPNGWMDLDGTWHGGGPWSTPQCARWGPSFPPQKGEQSRPQFSAHFYCGQAAGCIKVPLDMEVGFSTGDFVLDGDRVPLLKKGRSPLIFGPSPLWPNGCMDQDAAWYGGRRRPTRQCVRWGPSYPPLKVGAQLPIFGHCPLWPNGRMD